MRVNILYLLILIRSQSFCMKPPNIIIQYTAKNLTTNDAAATPIQTLMNEKLDAIDDVKEFYSKMTPIDRVFDGIMDVNGIPPAPITTVSILEGVLLISFVLKYKKYLMKQQAGPSSKRSKNESSVIFWLSVLINFTRNIHPVE